MLRALAGTAVIGTVLLMATPAAAAPAPVWSWPVQPHPVVRGFEAPATPYSAGHRGVDVRADEGATVRAPADGVVAFAGRVADREVLAIDHAGVRSTLEPVEAAVAVGDPVRRGQAVGVLGSGGDHPVGVLHLGARIHRGGQWVYVSPLLLLGGLQRAVLLPLGALPG